MCIGYLGFKTIFLRKKPTNGLKPTESTEKIMGPNFKYVSDYRLDFIQKMKNFNFETFEENTFDGIKIVSYFYKNPINTDKTAVLIHGYNSSGVVDFAKTGLEYLNRGFNVLLTCNRATGVSGGKYVGFGVLESKDTLIWLNKLVSLYPNGDIIIQGSSLGAVTACKLSEMDIPKNVKAIISDCAFANLNDEIHYLMGYLIGIKSKLLLKNIEFWCKRKAKYSFLESSPQTSVKNSKVPIMFIHGSEDRFIPVKNVDILYNACNAEKEKLIIPEAGHATSYAFGKENFYDPIFNFIDRFTIKN